ncbi:NlpC/P60 family protein [Actinocrispum sp. NPDC049592]|uniref:NlpC/P60 family protein n=1 Tax=Actinocrispum sp. NPDC049592 TaxID=3154835 RepID=UPI003412BEB7
MARYTAEQIYAFAREAGFSPDQAATMTAVALAESRGDSNAHNPYGEDSKGLWQINSAVHPQFRGMDLYDPVQNAKAAFSVSHGGNDISPWTTTHNGAMAKYVRYKADAQAAAAAYGDGPGRGMWSGSSGYGDVTSAGDGRGAGQGIHQTNTAPSGAGSDNVNVAQPVVNAGQGGAGPAHTPVYGSALDEDVMPGQGGEAQGFTTTGQPDAAAAGGAHTPVYGSALDEDAQQQVQQPVNTVPAQGTNVQPMGTGNPGTLQKFLDSAVAQSGDRYVFGAETNLDDPNPGVFDCSELVEWASHQAGVKMPDGAWNQYRHLAAEHSTMSVEQAIHTPGALLFSFDRDPMTGKPGAAHVAISLGNGKTIEAKGTQYGVGSWEANTRRFQYAGYMPEMMSGAGGAPFVPTPHTPAPPPDAFNHRVNNDPVHMDKQPETVNISHQMTAAPPPPEPPHAPEPPPPPPPDPQEVAHVEAAYGDTNSDGHDDALQHAMSWTTDDHALHPADYPVHDDTHTDDHAPGHP